MWSLGERIHRDVWLCPSITANPALPQYRLSSTAFVWAQLFNSKSLGSDNIYTSMIHSICQVAGTLKCLFTAWSLHEYVPQKPSPYLDIGKNLPKSKFIIVSLLWEFKTSLYVCSCPRKDSFCSIFGNQTYSYQAVHDISGFSQVTCFSYFPIKKLQMEENVWKSFQMERMYFLQGWNQRNTSIADTDN